MTDADTSPLFKPLQAGALSLPNRIVMAPLTRGRATPDAVPTPMMAEYYRQRASAGLIISEATAISRQGYGWSNAPGIYNDRQAGGWRNVTDSVRDQGGRIVLQLWHMGRVSHPDFQDNGALPVAPSAIAAKGQARGLDGKKPYVVPHALTETEIAKIVEDYAEAAKRAMDCGFDGIEIHGANGYLIDQFLRDGANKRTDGYGGSFRNRARFLREVLESICHAVGPAHVGLRLSPTGIANDMSDSDPAATFGHVADILNGFGIAYLHVREAVAGTANAVPGERITPLIRKIFKGVIIGNDGYDKASAERAIKAGEIDAVAFGVPYIANPDLVERFLNGAALASADTHTFYTNGESGYTDYPRMSVKKCA